MKKQSKKYLPLILGVSFVLVVIFIVGILLYNLTYRPEPVSVEKMCEVLSAHNLQPNDVTDAAADGFSGAGLKSCIIAEQDDLRFEFYEFDNFGAALQVQREARKLIVRSKMAYPRVQIETGSVNYQYYSLDAGGNYSVTIYVKNTAVYAYCNSENQNKLINIIADIAYADVQEEIVIPPWVSSLFRVLYFAAYIVVALVVRYWLWQAAYKSARVAKKEIEETKKTRKQLAKWLLQTSPRRKSTTLILLLHKGCLVFAYAGVALAIVGCFITELHDTLNTLGVMMPLIMFVMGLIGSMLSRKYNKR